MSSVFRQKSSKVLGIENNQMIRALAPGRPDQALNMTILPGRVERRGPIPDAHRSQASFEHTAKGSVIVANEILWCAVPGEGFGDLAR
jgi:hypothetical protein